MKLIRLYGNKVTGMATAALIGLTLLGANVDAAVIGVQFTGQMFTGTSSLLAPGDSAGLTGFESVNYNVFNRDTAGSGGFDGQLSGAALKGDDGLFTSATISTTGFDGVILTGSSNNTPNTKLFKHGFSISGGSSTTPTVTVSGLAASGYGTYDLNVYLSKHVFQGASPVSTTLTINGTPLSLSINQNNGSDTIFHDATTAGSGEFNYVRLTGLSGNLSLALAPAANAVAIDGFQIIQAVPEPSAALLSVCGFVGLILVRRLRFTHGS